MRDDQEYDLEGWLHKQGLWVLWDVTMDEEGQVTRIALSKDGQESMLVTCWAPTSGMLRKRVEP